MLTLVLLSQTIIVALVARVVYRRYFHPLARYPGPPIAAVTNLWRFFTFFGGQHHIVEQQLHDRFGPVVRVGPNSLSFSSLAGFETIYGYNKSLEKGDQYDFARDPATGMGSIFSARTDTIHRDLRKKVVGPALSTTKVASYEPVVGKHVTVLLSRLADILKVEPKSSTVNVASIVHRFTVDTLIDIIYGEPISPQPYTDLKASSGLLRDMRVSLNRSWGCSLLPWLGWLMNTKTIISLARKPTYDEEGNLQSIAALAAKSRTLIMEHPEVFETDSPNIVKSWLEVPEASSTWMDRMQTWRESYNLTFAGSGSTSAALISVLMELGTLEGRRWQERIRSELRGEIALDASPALTAVIKETLRLHAQFSTAFPRTIAPGAEDALADIAGPLPVGTTVSSNTFIVGQSKEIWGEDARVWNPQRWLEAQVGSKKLDDSFVVFSKGPRSCIGKDIALMMMVSAVSSLLQSWDFRLDGNVKAQNFVEVQHMTCKIVLSRIKG